MCAKSTLKLHVPILLTVTVVQQFPTDGVDPEEDETNSTVLFFVEPVRYHNPNRITRTGAGLLFDQNHFVFGQR